MMRPLFLNEICISADRRVCVSLACVFPSLSQSSASIRTYRRADGSLTCHLAVNGHIHASHCPDGASDIHRDCRLLCVEHGHSGCFHEWLSWRQERKRAVTNSVVGWGTETQGGQQRTHVYVLLGNTPYRMLCLGGKTCHLFTYAPTIDLTGKNKQIDQKIKIKIKKQG